MKLTDVHDFESAHRYVNEGTDQPNRFDRKNAVFVYLYGAGPKEIFRMTKQLTAEQFLAKATEEFNNPENPFPLDQVNVWLNRGDGVAVYQNEDLGHPQLGRRLFVSFGSSAAQCEGEAPERLPDGLFADLTGGINWRYLLEGTYRGEPLAGSESLDVVEDEDDESLPWVVDDTAGVDFENPVEGAIPIIGRFATEAEAAEFIGTLPDYETGRYGICGPSDDE